VKTDQTRVLASGSVETGSPFRKATKDTVQSG